MAPKNPHPAVSDDESSGSDEEQQHPPPKPINSRSKPPPSESDDDEDEESDEESGSDEETANKNKNQPLAKVDKKSQPQIDSDSESSDESDSESESETIAAVQTPRGPDPSIKPISSRPMDPSSSISKPKKSSAPAASPASPPLASSRKKPHAETPDQNGGETKKRKLFERIWSDDAEEKILKGIIDFYDRRGTKPSVSNSDMEAIRDFLKDSFNGAEFTKAQLINKIRRLKDKFKANSAKNGGSPNFTNSVDRTVYELSKKIWLPQEKANGNVGVTATKKGKESDTDEPDVPPKTPKKHPSNDVSVISAGADVVHEEFELAYPNFWEALTSAGTMKHADSAARRILSKVDSGKAAALEEKFRKYRKVELQNHLRWLELMKEVTKLCCEAVDKSD